MSTSIIPEISKKSKYWIPKYRFLELKYFCLQYPEWKREYSIIASMASNCRVEPSEIKTQLEFHDPTGNAAIRLEKLSSKISLVGKIAKMSDPEIGDYVLLAVTEGLSFVKLKTVYEIPCERDMYYDRFRRFFWLMDRAVG